MRYLFTFATLLWCWVLAAQDNLITLEKIFSKYEYYGKWSPQKRWVDNGDGYTILEKSEDGKSVDLVRYQTASSQRSVLLAATALVPAGSDQPLSIEDYEWSEDKSKLLVFTNSKRVWRYNTKGDYWIKDLKTGTLFQLGKDLAPSSLMFTKFSSDGTRVAFVSEHNLYVQDLASQKVTQLTFDGSEKIINGTFDWVYEEEFDCRDGFRWSPDGTKISFWRLDASPIRDFLMINNTDSVYSYTIPVQYPKVGMDNSAAKIGVADLKSGKTTWMNITEDISNNYVPRMEWADNSTELIVQQLNRAQNINNVTFCNASTGEARIVYTDKEEAWLDVVDDLMFFKKGQSFTWVSQKNGWKSAYEISRDGKIEKLITPGTFDIIDIELIDTKTGYIYYSASPDNATQRYLYRNKITTPGKPQRLSPANMPGTHKYDISPDGKWAFHTWSDANTPSVTSLISLPDHKVIKVITDNTDLKAKLAALKMAPMEFIQIKNDEGISFDVSVIKPVDFDPAKKYPVLFHVYGEPASQTVKDSWGSTGYLYHQMLAQNGYIVMSIDNRGTPAPKGRAWRKSIHSKIGVISSEDQAAVAKKLFAQYSFIDTNRVGIWGWSGGGSMTLNMLFRYPEIYKMGISVAPVTDLTLYDNVYQERYSGLLTERPEAYFNSSPVNFAKNLKGKLLLIHGTGDDNVHYQNAEILVNELIKQNKLFSFMAYPNRSHGIYEGRGTSRHLYETMFDYIKTNL